jgi:hypothetical protein
MSDADCISELEAALKSAKTTIAWIMMEHGGEMKLSTESLTSVMLSDGLELVTYDSPDGREQTHRLPIGEASENG